MLRGRDAGGIVGALLVHAAVLPLLGLVPLRSPATVRPDEGVTGIDLETQPPDTSLAALGVAPADRAGASPTRRPGAGYAPSHLTRDMRDAPLAPASVVAPLGPPDNPTEVVATRAPALTDDDLGIGRRNFFRGGLPPAAEAPDPGREAASRLDRSVRDALVRHDHSLGLDAAGALVALAEDCTRRSDAPFDGKATFEVTINAAGTIAGVRVLSAIQPSDTWQSVASKLSEVARSRSALIRPTGRPLRVRLEVSSRWVLPSGARPGRPLKPQATLYETWQTEGEAVIPLQPSAVAAGVRGDLSDIGARPVRDVHARILSEETCGGEKGEHCE